MEAFSSRLGRAERSIAHELIDVRDRLAHNAPFTWDDTERALDSACRLMAAIGAGDSARRIGNMREAVLRSKYVEHPPDAAHAPAPRSTPPPPGAAETPRRFTRDMFDAELNRMLGEARARARIPARWFRASCTAAWSAEASRTGCRRPATRCGSCGSAKGAIRTDRPHDSQPPVLDHRDRIPRVNRGSSATAPPRPLTPAIDRTPVPDSPRRPAVRNRAVAVAMAGQPRFAPSRGSSSGGGPAS